jgi:ATP-binding cassette, subfamily B, bacterial IrtA/YbtP
VDRILVVENGSVVQQGHHAELVDSDGLYARMWQEYRQVVQWTLRNEAPAEARSEAQYA